MFAKFDEIPSLSVEDIKEKPKCCGQLQGEITVTELAPSLYFSIINVHLVDNQCVAKFYYEIPPLPFQDIEKPNCRGRTDNMKTVYPPTKRGFNKPRHEKMCLWRFATG